MAPAARSSPSPTLPIRILSSRLVKASDPSLRPHVTAFSNLDLYPENVQASVVCLYPRQRKAAGEFEAVVSTFETVLPSLLNHLYPLAGRIVVDPTSGIPELHCLNQGAELIVGEVDVELGSLNYGLAEESLKKIMLPYHESVTLSVQLLSFACGSFTVVWGVNNLVMDGSAGAMCVRMWSRLARTGTIGEGVTPNHDRSVFRPRNPPAYSAAIKEMFTTYDDHRIVNALTAEVSFIERLYYIEASDIARLREEASTKLRRSSRVQAVSAYLWKVFASVVAASPLPEERCRMGWMVDGRHRVRAPELVPAMRSYFGNVTTYALADVSVREIQEKPLAEVAAMVQETITSIDYDAYVQELVDWVEDHKTAGGLMEKGVLGLGTPTVNQTVFASFPLDTDFGFGQAAIALSMCDYGRLCSGYLSVGARPGGDGSWQVSAFIWPQLAAALERDPRRIFKPMTAESLGFTRGKNHLRDPTPKPRL